MRDARDDYAHFLSDDQWAQIEKSALIVLRERLKYRKRFIQDNPELAAELNKINARLFQVSEMIEELNRQE
jgi:hypothetical protein